MSFASIPLLLAQASPSGGGGAMNIVFFGALFLIMYFVLIRPQQRQQKEQAAMLTALKKGDDVITSAGIFGKVFAIDEKTVTLEIMSGGKLRILKTSVQGKVNVEVVNTSADAKKEEK